jgi:nicotinamide mononucleotide adenylyltransferase
LQPEHLLRAFEAGADLVCVVACAEDNCHTLEGSRRAARRSDYVRGLLDQIGSGAERLLLLHLPGSARQDMAAGLPGAVAAAAVNSDAELTGALASLAAQVAARLESLPPNPLHKPQASPQPATAGAGAEQAAAGAALEDQDNED